MKPITLLIKVVMLCTVNNYVHAQWTQNADFTGTVRRGAVGFTIGSKVYFGTGFDGTLYKDFWEYDTLTDNWTKKADFKGTARWDAVGFSIGSKGYIGTGYTGTAFKKDFWEYDPISDSWTQKANFGGPVRRSAVGFSIGTKGYIGTGYGTPAGTYYQDFWEYDLENDIWTQKSDFGGTPRQEAVGFSIGSKGYIGTGQDINKNYYKDFWEFDPITNAWKEKTYFGGTARTGAVGFSIGLKGYIGTGLNGMFPYPEHKDFWEYNPISDKWTQKLDLVGQARFEAVGFSNITRGYIITGQGQGYLKDFWEYLPNSGVYINEINNTTEIKIYPNPANDCIYLQTVNKTLKVFQIYSIEGKQLLYKDIQNLAYKSQAIELIDISPGIYIYHCETDQGSSHGKLIVRH